MPEQLELTAERFAIWARRNEVALPYPLDVTDIPVSTDEPAPVTDPLLDRFARVARAPRVSAFALRTVPSGDTAVVVAVAGADDAVSVLYSAGRVRLRRTRDTELATGVVGELPDLAAFPTPPVELAEPVWTDLIAKIGDGEPSRHARGRLHDAGIPGPLAEVLLATAPGSVPIGTLAAMAWTDAATLGPSMASWQEYERGAVLTSLHRSRRSGRATVRIAGYSREDAMRALIDAVSSALALRTRPDRD